MYPMPILPSVVCSKTIWQPTHLSNNILQQQVFTFHHLSWYSDILVSFSTTSTADPSPATFINTAPTMRGLLILGSLHRRHSQLIPWHPGLFQYHLHCRPFTCHLYQHCTYHEGSSHTWFSSPSTPSQLIPWHPGLFQYHLHCRPFTCHLYQHCTYHEGSSHTWFSSPSTLSADTLTSWYLPVPPPLPTLHLPPLSTLHLPWGVFSYLVLFTVRPLCWYPGIRVSSKTTSTPGSSSLSTRRSGVTGSATDVWKIAKLRQTEFCVQHHPILDIPLITWPLNQHQLDIDLIRKCRIEMFIQWPFLSWTFDVSHNHSNSKIHR